MVARPAASIAEDTPRSVVERTAAAVVKALNDDSLSGDEKRRRIEDIVGRETNFTTLSSLVLARNWRPLTAAQRDDFVREFRRHLTITYGRNLEKYKDVRIDVIGDREEARGDRTVLTRAVRPGEEPVAMDYRLRWENDRWQIIDLVIEGVSLVSNFRSQFQAILSNGGFERLMKALREKNASGEPLHS